MAADDQAVCRDRAADVLAEAWQVAVRGLAAEHDPAVATGPTSAAFRRPVDGLAQALALALAADWLAAALGPARAGGPVAGDPTLRAVPVAGGLAAANSLAAVGDPVGVPQLAT